MIRDALGALPRRALPAAGLGLLLILVIATVVVLAVLRAESLERAEMHLENLATALGGQTWQSVRSIEVIARTTAEEMKERLSGKRDISDTQTFERIRERMAMLPGVRAVAYIGPRGDAVLHSSAFPTPRVNYGDREYFTVHRERRIEGLYVGQPVFGRLTSEWLNVFSTRVEDGRGGFGGVVVTAVRMPYFENLFAPLKLGEDGRAFLFREDGILLATYPARDGVLGRSFADDALFKEALASGAEGARRRAGLLDAKPRIVAFERVTGYPLIVTVSVTEDSALAPWRRDAWQIGAGVAGAVVFIALALLFLRRQLAVSAGLRHDLRETAERMHGIIASAMDAVITVDAQQKIVLFNEAAERVFRCPAGEAVGSPLERFIPERFRAAHRAHIAEFGRAGATRRMMGAQLDLAGLRADGEEFPIDASISQVAVDGKKFYTVILRDITERKAAEVALKRSYRELRESSERLLGIIQSAMDAVITMDQDHRIVLFNEAAEKIFGCPAEDAVGSPLERFLPERFRAVHRGHIERFGATRVTTRTMGGNLCLVGLRSNGEEFPIDASISQVTVEGRKLYTVILRDITDRRRAEAALERSNRELRELSAAMHEVREAERTRIARELHDELAQWLTALRMDVSWLAARLPQEQAQLVTRTEKMKGVVDTTVAAVRRIAAALRPVMLDDLGLVPAVESLLHDLSQRTGILVGLQAEADGLDFGEPVASSLYRIAQEALTNVARHADATQVDVGIRLDGDRLVMTVRDNGRGFDPEAAARRKSYGVLGIRERAHTLGGSARIERLAAGGTLVEIAIPIARYRRREAAGDTGTAR